MSEEIRILGDAGPASPQHADEKGGPGRGEVAPPGEAPTGPSASGGPAAEEDPKPRVPASLRFLERFLPEPFVFPFKGEGSLVLAGGVVAYTAVYLPFFLFWQIAVLTGILHFFLDLYLAVYLFQLTGISWKDPKQLPDWPDLADIVEDAWKPLILMIAAVIVSALAPAICCTLLRQPFHPVVLLALCGSIVYFPMQALAVAVTQTTGALNPLLVLRSIARTRRRYPVCVLSFLFTVAACSASALLLFLPIPLLGWVAFHFLLIYCLAVNARVLGRFYHDHAATLRWFDDLR